MKKLSLLSISLLMVVFSQVSQAACSDISRKALQDAALGVTRAANVNTAGGTGGFGLNMWVTFVDETGLVCEVVTTGTRGTLAGNSAWLGSRIISAQKANTANAFSLNGVSISSGALYAAVQPGGSLYGLQHSNPVDASEAYAGDPASYGRPTDPIKGKRLGGVNVFGGGLALYNASGKKIGAIGVSGDTSCTDHAFAWKVRETLNMDNGPGGFELLNLTSSYAALGDHPVCANIGSINNVAGFGFQ